MPRFRSAKAQAAHAVSNKIALGRARHDNREDGQIHSVGTARGYEQALKGFTRYLQEQKLGGLGNATSDHARDYLAERASLVAQKTLDLDRQAIQVHLGVRLEVLKSEKPTNLSTRSYTRSQIDRVASSQSFRNSLATMIAHAAGLRAHELLTLKRVNERPVSSHREWSPRRFVGRDGVRYTVEGKGGLVREVLLPKEISARLEATRLQTPQLIIDRGVRYFKNYDIAGGRAWSQSFSAASQRALGFTNGAHGLRHSYAQERMDELQRRGVSCQAAKGIVAQEVGHFDKDTTEAYLR